MRRDGRRADSFLQRRATLCGKRTREYAATAREAAAARNETAAANNARLGRQCAHATKGPAC